MLDTYWPLFGLRLRTPRLELRIPRDEDLADLIEVVHGGIHDPAVMPFGRAWTDAESPELERKALQFWWRTRAELSVDHWALPFMVVVDGRTAGMQDLVADGFRERRLVSSGSWLGQAFQGQGFGKEMRAAALHLAFEGLGADVAVSESFLDNPQSIGVSRALGYEEDGRGRWAPRGEPVDSIRWRLTRERFDELRADGRYPEVSIENLEPCLPLLGLD